MKNKKIEKIRYGLLHYWVGHKVWRWLFHCIRCNRCVKKNDKGFQDWKCGTCNRHNKPNT